FNQEAWDFNYGEPFTKETEDRIINALKADYIKGFSLLGGEPFEPANQQVLCGVLERIKAEYPNKDVWCYTGYTFDTDLLSGRLCDYSITKRMLDCIDILVDGKFVEAKKDLTLRFKGSSNQRIIDVQRSMKEDKIIRWSEDRIDE
ncbi:MAG: anaerobic ribonucleoside-triphosphate reductase activating protein, partial [Ruminococcus sp.]|nr:anaerobic ribonucleoside-triphosphate reductase activating protein [Ruminococcus sp.]